MARPVTLPDASDWDDILPEREPLPDDARIFREAALSDPAILRYYVHRAIFPLPEDGRVGNPVWQAAWLKAYPEDNPDGQAD